MPSQWQKFTGVAYQGHTTKKTSEEGKKGVCNGPLAAYVGLMGIVVVALEPFGSINTTTRRNKMSVYCRVVATHFPANISGPYC